MIAHLVVPAFKDAVNDVLEITPVALVGASRVPIESLFGQPPVHVAANSLPSVPRVGAARHFGVSDGLVQSVFHDFIMPWHNPGVKQNPQTQPPNVYSGVL